MSLHKLRTPKPGEVPLGTFFGHVLPTVLVDAPDERTSSGGRYCFVVEGDGGGTWTVDLAARSVVPIRAAADVTLTLSTSACAALLKGRPRPADIAIAGDATLLLRLATLLTSFATGSPGGSP